MGHSAIRERQSQQGSAAPLPRAPHVPGLLYRRPKSTGPGVSAARGGAGGRSPLSHPQAPSYSGLPSFMGKTSLWSDIKSNTHYSNSAFCVLRISSWERWLPLRSGSHSQGCWTSQGRGELQGSRKQSCSTSPNRRGGGRGQGREGLAQWGLQHRTGVLQPA